MKALIDCEICAKSFEAEFRGQAPLTCSEDCWREKQRRYMKARRKSSLEETLRSIVAGCRNRAKRKDYECNIDIEFMLDLLTKQNGRCAATNIPLEASAANTKMYSNPWTISVDRIKNERGYTKDNVRLVTYMYNTCKGQWTEEQVVHMCKGRLEVEGL